MRIPREVARLQLRRGWRSLLGIGVLVALGSGLGLGALAGARRTATAVDRMIDDGEIAHVLVNPDNGDESALDFDAVARLPMVEDLSRAQGVAVIPDDGAGITLENLFAGPRTIASVDGHAPTRFHRPVLASGRLPDPTRADEVLVSNRFAVTSGLGVGDSLAVVIPSGEEIGELLSFESLGDEGFARAAEFLASPGFGTSVELQIVGTGTWLDGVVVDEGYEPFQMWLTPALYADAGEPSLGYGGAVVRLDDDGSIDDFRRAVEAMVPDEKIVFQTRDGLRAKVLRGTMPAAVALAIFGAIVLLSGLVLVGQATSRWCRLDARENQTLAAMGSTRADRAVSQVLRLAVTFGLGLVAAVLLAVLVSPFTPVGAARWIEPDRGFEVDRVVLLGGVAILFLVVAGMAAVSAWRSSPPAHPSGVLRGSRCARWLDSVGAPSHTTLGVRFALEPGRGSTSVPTRATNAGAVTAIAVAVATIVFAASLDRMTEEGRFYGTTFDVTFDWDGDALNTEAGRADLASILIADPDVERVGFLRITEARVSGEPVTALSYESPSSDGDAFQPTIGAGRAPVAPGEIALGASTMRDLGVGIGDQVAVASFGFDGTAEVVGRVVLPGAGLYEGSDRTSIGTGAFLPAAALAPFDETPDRALIVADLDPSADQDEFAARIVEAWSSAESAGTTELYPSPAPRPSEIEGLRELRSLPVLLSAMLVGLVGLTVVQAMVVAVRRRRRDVAVLQAIGSTSRGVMSVGVAQGATIAAVGMLIGVPLGIATGRWLWIALANEFGTLAEPVVPLPVVIALLAVVMFVACLAGALPTFAGLRQRPAEALRAE